MSWHLWWKTREQFLPPKPFLESFLDIQFDRSHKIPKRKITKKGIFFHRNLATEVRFQSFNVCDSNFLALNLRAKNPWKQDCISTNVNVLKRSDMDFLWIDLGFCEQRKKKGALQWRNQEKHRNVAPQFTAGFCGLEETKPFLLAFWGVARVECLFGRFSHLKAFGNHSGAWSRQEKPGNAWDLKEAKLRYF